MSLIPRKTVNPNLYSQLTRSEVDVILMARAGVDHIDKVPAQLVLDLAAAKDAESRMIAARFRGVPLETLAALADDRDPNVRAAVTVNTSATSEILDAAFDPEKTPGFLYKTKHAAARTAIFNGLCAHSKTTLDTHREVVAVAGKDSAAGRYSQERIAIAATQEQLEARKAAKALA